MLRTRADEISEIAFGFMASKALFSALHFDMFTHLNKGPQTATEIGKGFRFAS